MHTKHPIHAHPPNTPMHARPLQHTANLPTVMRLPEVVVGVSIGNSHSVLQMRSGRLMSMGCNGRHQTGVCAGEGWSTNIDNYTYIETWGQGMTSQWMDLIYNLHRAITIMYTDV